MWSSGAKPISSMMISSLRHTALDGAADGVVGDGAVEVLDELDGGEVADLVAGFDGGAAERDEVVGLAGAGGSDEAQVVGSADPVEGDQVVVAGRRDRGLGEVELVEGLDDGEPGGGHPVAACSTRRVTAISSVDEDAQGLFGCPALRLGGEQDVGAWRRIVDSFNRFSPASRSAGSAGGGACGLMRGSRSGRRRS